MGPLGDTLWRDTAVELPGESVRTLVGDSGTTVSPVARRWRREQLGELVDADVLASFDTPRGRVWVPLELPDGVEVQHAATAARA